MTAKNSVFFQQSNPFQPIAKPFICQYGINTRHFIFHCAHPPMPLLHPVLPLW